MNWQKIKRNMDKEAHQQSLYKNDYENMLYWIMFGLVVMMSVLCGLCGKEDDLGFIVYYTYTIFVGIMYAMKFTAAYSITENNKKTNIFKKLMYIPVNMKDLLIARTILIIKQALIPTIIFQVIALVINLLYNVGKVVLTLQLFWPLITGVIMVLLHVLQMYGNCKKAME